ncbi:unnamed protein product [Prorocentrum cordatum]|uniref:Uncharacterized protein n=1 Tax=Prorocentrum cordatum TaxID=2364126 RepID=A0ABN9TA73_9DINO|nr:unnamed protein product [Polarella glacialis]
MGSGAAGHGEKGQGRAERGSGGFKRKRGDSRRQAAGVGRGSLVTSSQSMEHSKQTGLECTSALALTDRRKTSAPAIAVTQAISDGECAELATETLSSHGSSSSFEAEAKGYRACAREFQAVQQQEEELRRSLHQARVALRAARGGACALKEDGAACGAAPAACRRGGDGTGGGCSAPSPGPAPLLGALPTPARARPGRAAARG